MRILMLNCFDVTGGAARAAYRLHKGLRGIDQDSLMFVQNKVVNDDTVISHSTKLGKLSGKIRPHLDALPLKWYPNRTEATFSPAVVPDRIASKIMCLAPDIVHLHWITNGFLRIETLGGLKKPLIWTLHDSWAFTGGCHIPFECTGYRQRCGSCPALCSTMEKDLSRRIWIRKKRAWKDLDLTIVTPSRWLADCARSSSLLRDVRIEVIPNGLDLQRYKPVDKVVARELLSLPQDKKFVLFGAMGSTSDKNKGFHLLLPAIQKLAAEGWGKKIELIVFGAAEPTDAPGFGLKTHYLGHLYDDISLTILYSVADVMMVPSIQEAFGQTASEAMACGTPVVAFGATGLLDIVDHEINGYLAKPYDIDDLAHGVTWVLESEERWHGLSRRSREKVKNEFAIDKISKKYVKLYQEIIG